MSRSDEIPFDAGPDFDLSAQCTEARRELRRVALDNPELLGLIATAITYSEHEAIRLERARLRQELQHDHFDVMWDSLRSEKFVKIARRISLHDARQFFKAMRQTLVEAAGLTLKERDQ
jgi:transposase-like protein